jgi:two-component system cell cycle sensor histidine kinase/response regulator CckA
MSVPAILIVEDEVIIAADIANKLRRLGYEVVGLTNTGEKAIEIALQFRPSLVLMDIRLAGAMDGITAADAIRQACQLPVVFLSAHSDPCTVQRARQAEAFGFIMKPFEDRELHTQIEMALYKHAAERRLQESESRLREVLENSLDASYKRNLQTRSYDYLSPVFSRISGYTPAEMAALSIETMRTLIHPDDQAEVERVISGSKSGEAGAAYHMEYRFRHKKGHYIWLHNQFTIMRDASGQPLASIGIVRDITDRKRDEAERAKLEVQNMQLQKAESLGRMAGAIAHHFNNQFQVVMGNLEMAMNGLPLGANPIAYLASAMQATQKAAEVSSLMLTYLGQAPGKHEPMDLSESCRQSLTLLQAAVPKGTIIKSEFPSIGPVIHANTGQIRHVLINLITNAWESADESRRGIGLTVRTVSREDIPASMRFPIDWQPVDSAYACLEVTDAGCGIAEMDIEKIFDPFFSTKFTGRGLGLSVVLGIVRAHHGAVAVESTPDSGSVFRIFLPVSAEALPHQPGRDVQVPKTEERGTVLLVEDEEMLRKMTAEMLRHIGFRVLQAKDGVDAVEVFRQHREEIRCVVCDLTMPRMGGWETLAALRKISPDIPVILSSGYDEAQVMSGEHSVRPNAFLGKPYWLQELSDTLQNTLAEATNSILQDHKSDLTDMQQ